MNNNLNKLVEHLILFGLIGGLVIPSVNLGVGINVITPISILLIFTLPQLVLKGRFKVDWFIGMYILILISIFISMNYGYIFLSVNESYRDYMELFRYFQFLPYLVVAKYLDYASFEKKLMTYIFIAASLVILVSFFQITNVGNLAPFFGGLYATAEHLDSMLYSSKRVIATGSDPNVGAVITAFLLFFICFSKYKTLVKITFLSSLLIILLFTQSRTVLIGVGISLSILFVLFSSFNIIIKIIIAFLTLLLIPALFNTLELEYVTVGLQMAMDGDNGSLNARFDNITTAIERWKESWFFGQGPAKSSGLTIIDSEYALILQRYGSLGIFLFLSFIFLNVKTSLGLLGCSANNKINISLLGLGFTIVALVLMCTNNYFAGYQTAAIPILIAVLLMLSKQNQKKVKNVY